MNLELSGGEAITLLSIGGAMGFRLLNATVPPENWGFQPVYPDDDNPGDEPTDAQCTLDLSPPVIDTDQLQPPAGLFSGQTPVISASYADYADQSEIDPASVRLLVDSVDVTAQAVVDSQTIQYTPAAALGEGPHSVSLSVADQWGYAATDPFNWTFTVDTLPPDNSGATVTINNGTSYTAATTLDLAWSGFADSVSGITGYYYSLVDGSGSDSGIATNIHGGSTHI